MTAVVLAWLRRERLKVCAPIVLVGALGAAVIVWFVAGVAVIL